ncbi:MAG: lactonase family protein [Kiritimatiellaeota bacterium]|nr:lactonase family protein [Kiritimatiellota bacterium]
MMASLLAAQTSVAQSIDVYFGTYKKVDFPEGIYHAVLDLKTGSLSSLKLACAASSPSFIEIHPNSKFLYAVIGGNPGEVDAFAIEPETKKLKLLNKSSSGGKGPCHLSIATDGSVLLVANYDSGSVASIPINKDGSLAEPASFMQHIGSSVNPQRQKEPHAHSINLSPDNRFAYVADLGLDKIMIYRLDSKSGRLLQNDPPEKKIKPGAGPRHISFGPNGKFAYLINELDETIIVFAHDSKSGKLSEIQTISTLPKGFAGASYCAEVRVHPGGKFLYGSNRGHDSIVIYKIDPEKGVLTLLGFQNYGIKNPRNFNIDPTGQFCVVANQDSDTVIVFRINQETGLLEPTEYVIKIGGPVCVRFLLR